jgi:16S rRNA (uracil1498-N3)-methyltransferase
LVERRKFQPPDHNLAIEALGASVRQPSAGERAKMLRGSHTLRALSAFAVCLLSPHAARQRDGGARTPQALNRLLVERDEVVWGPGSSARVTLPPTDLRATHVREILHTDKLRAGVVNEFLIDDAPVSILGDLSVQIDMPAELRRPPPPPPAITLMLALPRPKVLLRMLPHIAAIGVKRVVLVGAYKVEKAYFGSDIVNRPAVARAALLEGVMQSGVDVYVPEVTSERFLKPFLEDRLPSLARPGAMRILAEPDADGTRVAAVVAAASRVAAGAASCEAVLAVGPEGGWMPREISMMENQHGFARVSLGPRVLKTEAAVLILLGLLHDATARVDPADVAAVDAGVAGPANQ